MRIHGGNIIFPQNKNKEEFPIFILLALNELFLFLFIYSTFLLSLLYPLLEDFAVFRLFSSLKLISRLIVFPQNLIIFYSVNM